MKEVFSVIGALFLSVFSFAQSITQSGLSPDRFDEVIDGKRTGLYTLVTSGGMEACVTNYGARLVSLMYQGKDLVLGFDNVSDYRKYRQNYGATVGRYVGRIYGASFVLDGQVVKLQENGRGVTSHGGYPGFADKVWDVIGCTDSTLTLQYVSPDGENGFPGELTVRLTYCITCRKCYSEKEKRFVQTPALELNYEATTTQPTVLNLTNHSFFNLSGNLQNTVMSELLMVNSDSIATFDENKNLNGAFLSVEGTPFDFCHQPKRIGDRIDEDNGQLRITGGYDHSFVLNTCGDDSKPAASIYDEDSRIRMTVYTTEPVLHIYSGNGLKGNTPGKQGISYPRRSAICFEAMHLADSPNHPTFPTTVLRPGDTYRQHTAYVFSSLSGE